MPKPETTAEEIATTFAAALDAGDLGTVAHLLAPNVVCRDGDTLVQGGEQVAELYRTALRWMEQAFDEARRQSVLERVAHDRFRLDVTTAVMRVPGHWHRLRHARDVTVDGGLIASIVHRAEAEAASAFRAFVTACSAPPPPPGFGV